jgi:hypothetical protein
MKTISIISKADEGQSNVWDFPVFQEELKTRAGKRSGIHAVIREDTGDVIGQYKGVKMTENRIIVNEAEDRFASLGLAFKREKFITTQGGARFFGQYSIGKMDIAEEKFDQTVTITNSYNGSLKIALELAIMRLLCLNLMEGFVTVLSQLRKHSESTSIIQEIGENFAKGIDDSTKAIAQTVHKMREIELTDAQVETVLSNLAHKGAKIGVGEKHAVMIYRNWTVPSKDELPLGNTVYRLYNAATRYTRDVANIGREEMSRRANTFITGAFDLSIRQNSFAQSFLVPSVSPIAFGDYSAN